MQGVVRGADAGKGRGVMQVDPHLVKAGVCVQCNAQVADEGFGDREMPTGTDM